MADCSHLFGSDFALSATGDLLLATGDEASKQRILRRLLTVTRDYLWQPDYGAGLFCRSCAESAKKAELASLEDYRGHDAEHAGEGELAGRVAAPRRPVAKDEVVIEQVFRHEARDGAAEE